MRSLRVIGSLIGNIFRLTFPQAVAKRNAVVEDKTFAAPAAFGFRHVFQIPQNSAPEMIDLAKTARQQIGAGLFAADAAGAEHRDLAVFRRVEMSRDKFLELPEAPDAGIDGARE